MKITGINHVNKGFDKDVVVVLNVELLETEIDVVSTLINIKYREDINKNSMSVLVFAHVNGKEIISVYTSAYGADKNGTQIGEMDINFLTDEYQTIAKQYVNEHYIGNEAQYSLF
jgi:hypothetical protein